VTHWIGYRYVLFNTRASLHEPYITMIYLRLKTRLPVIAITSGRSIRLYESKIKRKLKMFTISSTKMSGRRLVQRRVCGCARLNSSYWFLYPQVWEVFFHFSRVSKKWHKSGRSNTGRLTCLPHPVYHILSLILKEQLTH